MNAWGFHCHCEDRRDQFCQQNCYAKNTFSEMKRTVPPGPLRAEVLHISVLPEGLTVEPAVSSDCSGFSC